MTHATSQRIDALVVTALREEYDALLAQLPDRRAEQLVDDQAAHVFLADIQREPSLGSRPVTRIAVVLLSRMGRLDAGIEITRAIDRWRPSLVLMVGIAGGIAEAGVGLGDILLADQIVDYSIQKAHRRGRTIHPQGHDVDQTCLSIAHAIPKEGWFSRTSARPRSAASRVHVGPVGSGDTIVAHRPLLKKLRAAFPKLIGVEMEAAGVAIACFRSADRPAFFMVRAASDLADANKNSTSVKRWRPYACSAAASFALALLERVPITNRSTAPPSPTRVASTKKDLPATPAEYLFHCNGVELEVLHAASDLNGPVFSLSPGSPVPSGPGVTLEVEPDVETLSDLKRAFQVLHSLFELSPRATFAISQSEDAWFGFGVGEFLRQAESINVRYAGIDGRRHHSEALAYFQECVGGYFLLTAQRSVQRDELHHVAIEFRLPGIPVDVAPFVRLCEELNAAQPYFVPVEREDREHERQRHVFRDGRIKLAVKGRVLRRSDKTVVGIVAANPFATKKPPSMKDWHRIESCATWILRLRDWHDLGDVVDHYELVDLEEIKCLESILRVGCTWGRLVR